MIFQVGNEVAGHLGGPGTIGVSRHTEEVDDPGPDLDDEQHVVPTRQDAVDGEEVRGQDQLSLGVQEL